MDKWISILNLIQICHKFQSVISVRSLDMFSNKIWTSWKDRRKEEVKLVIAPWIFPFVSKNLTKVKREQRILRREIFEKFRANGNYIFKYSGVARNLAGGLKGRLGRRFCRGPEAPASLNSGKFLKHSKNLS